MQGTWAQILGAGGSRIPQGSSIPLKIVCIEPARYNKGGHHNKKPEYLKLGAALASHD